MIPISFGFAFFGLLFASLFDLKTREVPDWLNFSLIAVGVAASIIYSLIILSFTPFLSSIIGFAICFVFGLIFYKAGQWGGGDAKMLMALGTLIGFDLSGEFPILLILLLNIFVVGAIYGIFWSFYLSIAHWKAFKKAFRDLMTTPKAKAFRRTIQVVALAVIIASFFVSFAVKTVLLGTVAAFFSGFYFYVYSKAIEKSSMEKLAFVSKISEGEWIVDPYYTVKQEAVSPYNYFFRKFQKGFPVRSLSLAILELIESYKHTAFIGSLIKRKEKKIFYKHSARWNKEYDAFVERIISYHDSRSSNSSKKKDLKKLKLAIHEFLQFDEAPVKKTPLIDSIIKYLNKQGYFYDKDLVCGPDQKDGLTKEQLAKLKKLKVKRIKIKEGIPFLPSFFIAFIVTLWFGNWLVLFV